jgi:hypothetical protein
MSRRYQLFDILIMGVQPGLDLGLIDVGGALLFAGKEEVEVGAEAEPGKEGNELQDGGEDGGRGGQDGETDPVDEPGVEEGGIGGGEGFVGGVDGEENGEEDAGRVC